MKTSANLAAWSLFLYLFSGIALLSPESAAVHSTQLEGFIPSGNAFRQHKHQGVFLAAEISSVPTDADFSSMSINTPDDLPPADVEYPDAGQKITFTAIAGTIAFVFLFLALLGTKVVRDNEYFKTLKLNVLSPVKVSVLVSFYFMLIEFLLCFWIQGSAPKLSPGILIFGVIALSTAVFHHLLKLKNVSGQHLNFNRLQVLLNALIPLTNVLITLYLVNPTIHESSFNDVPEFIIIPYLVLSLLHVGVRAYGSAISGSAVFKHMVQPELKKNITI